MKRLFIVAMALVFTLLVSVFVIVYTNGGSRWVIGRALAYYLHADQYELEDIQGNLWQGLSLRHATFYGLQGLPSKSTLKVQEFYAKISFLNWSQTELEVKNVRLTLPASDTVIGELHYKDHQFLANIYGKSLDVGEIQNYYNSPLIRALSGEIQDFDIVLDGAWDDLKLKGQLTVKSLTYQDYALRNSLVSIDMHLRKRFMRNYQTDGFFEFDQGQLEAKALKFKIEKSRFHFDREWMNPNLNIRLTTTIKKHTIYAHVKGSRQDPKLSLTSSPPLAQEKIMVMLMTGTNWDVLADAIDHRRMTPELTGDLARFFLFSGQGKSVANALGLNDVRVLFDKKTRGVGLSKDLLKRLQVDYQIKQTTQDNQQIETEHTIGGELKVNSKVSISVDKKISTVNDPDSNKTLETDSENKVMLKFKTDF